MNMFSVNLRQESAFALTIPIPPEGNYLPSSALSVLFHQQLTSVILHFNCLSITYAHQWLMLYVIKSSSLANLVLTNNYILLWFKVCERLRELASGDASSYSVIIHK